MNKDDQQHTHGLQANADVNPSKENYNSELVERHKVNNTQFEIVGNQEHGYRLGLGKLALTNTFPSVQEVELQLKTKPWEITITLIIALATEVIKMQEEETTAKLRKFMEENPPQEIDEDQ